MIENGSQRVYEMEQVLKKPGRKPDGQQGANGGAGKTANRGASKGANGGPTRGTMGSQH